MKIPKTKDEAIAMAKAAGADLGDYLDGVDDDNFDGREFVRRLVASAGTDWPMLVIRMVLTILAWEVLWAVGRVVL